MAVGIFVLSMLGCGGAGSAAGRDKARRPHLAACSEAPSALQLGASLFARTRSGESHVASSCVRRASPECSYTFEVRQRADLRATLFSQNFDGALSLYALEPGRELGCADDSPLGDTHRARLDVSLDPGKYALHVEASNEHAGEFELFAEIDPLPSLAGVCAAAQPLQEGIFQRGSTRGAASMFALSCQGRGVGPDQAYTFSLDRRRRVRVREQSDFDALLSLRAACEGDELLCSDDSPSGHAQLTKELASGSYYLVVDGYTRGDGGDYVLALEQADPPPAVDHIQRCGSLPNLAEGVFQEIDTFHEPASTDASCAEEGAPEALFMFVLREARHVRVFASEFEFEPVFSLRRACEYLESEVVCAALPRRSAPSFESSEQLVFELDLPAGDYMLGVDGATRDAMGAGTVRLQTQKAQP
jgi:hypothetical protein